MGLFAQGIDTYRFFLEWVFRLNGGDVGLPKLDLAIGRGDRPISRIHSS